jgi:hypothetical protein
MSQTEKRPLYDVVAEIQPGFVIARVDVRDLREQDKNAHLMNPVMFNRLRDNIKKRGRWSLFRFAPW